MAQRSINNLGFLENISYSDVSGSCNFDEISIRKNLAPSKQMVDKWFAEVAVQWRWTLRASKRDGDIEKPKKVYKLVLR